MRKVKGLIMLGAVLLLGSLPLATPVFAQNSTGATNTHGNIICQLLPFLDTTVFGIDKICGKPSAAGASTAQQVASIVRFAVSLIFIGIILFAVVTIIRAAIKYIQSEGNEAKIQEASKAIKAVFIGIAALFVGVIGLIIIVVFFQGATGASNALGNSDTSSIPGINQLTQ